MKGGGDRQYNVSMGSGELKSWTCPTGVHRDIFCPSLSPTLFFVSLFCNFNLTTKYSCGVLSVTDSCSLGFSHCVTKTIYSLFESFCLSFFHILSLCVSVQGKTQ